MKTTIESFEHKGNKVEVTETVTKKVIKAEKGVAPWKVGNTWTDKEYSVFVNGKYHHSPSFCTKKTNKIINSICIAEIKSQIN